jgi:kynurenine formamidase
MLDDLGLFTPEDIEKRVDVQEGDILFIHTGWHRYSFFSEEADEERYIQRHPGPHFSICDWLLSKKIHIWGVDMISTDHPMNLPLVASSARVGWNIGKKSARRQKPSSAQIRWMNSSLIQRIN